MTIRLRPSEPGVGDDLALFLCRHVRSACSSPLRRPAYKAVAHSALSGLGTAPTELRCFGRICDAVALPARGWEAKTSRRVDRDIAAIERAAVDDPQRRNRVPDRARVESLGEEAIDQIEHIPTRHVSELLRVTRPSRSGTPRDARRRGSGRGKGRRSGPMCRLGENGSRGRATRSGC